MSENLTISSTEENYLKVIYKIEEKGNKQVSTSAIAKSMKTKSASVTEMLKRLAEKELIFYTPYKGVKLSETGRSKAVTLIRKHRLWEVFLLDKLRFKWDEVHLIAEQLEHIQSPELIKRLDQFLNYPMVDPHGDPIPNEAGEMRKLERIALIELKSGEGGTLTGVEDTSVDFLQYLDSQQIALGDQILVERVLPFDQSLLIKLNDKRTISLSREVAKNILVKQE